MSLASSMPRSARNDPHDIRLLLPLQKMERNVDAWAQQYRQNQPYPHIGIDNFFDETVIQDLASDYPDHSHPAWKRASFDAEYEEEKLSLDQLEEFPPNIRVFVETLNSAVFLRFLERLVGIRRSHSGSIFGWRGLAHDPAWRSPWRPRRFQHS